MKYVVSNPSSYLYLYATREFEEGKDCGSYNEWGYGLDKRVGYAKQVSDEDLRARSAARDVTYLLGELDTIPGGGFDESCAAMALVPACEHNGRCFNNCLTVLVN